MFVWTKCFAHIHQTSLPVIYFLVMQFLMLHGDQVIADIKVVFSCFCCIIEWIGLFGAHLELISHLPILTFLLYLCGHNDWGINREPNGNYATKWKHCWPSTTRWLPFLLFKDWWYPTTQLEAMHIEILDCAIPLKCPSNILGSPSCIYRTMSPMSGS